MAIQDYGQIAIQSNYTYGHSDATDCHVIDRLCLFSSLTCQVAACLLFLFKKLAEAGEPPCETTGLGYHGSSMRVNSPGKRHSRRLASLRWALLTGNSQLCPGFSALSGSATWFTRIAPGPQWKSIPAVMNLCRRHRRQARENLQPHQPTSERWFPPVLFCDRT